METGTRTETVEQRLLRVLRELAAPHAISPEGRQAILPLVPLAEQIEKTAREHEQEWRASYEREQSAHADAAALRAELKLADEKIAALEREVESNKLTREETRALAASINSPTDDRDPVQRGHKPGTLPPDAQADMGGPPDQKKGRKGK